MKTAVTQMTPEERAEYRKILLAKANPTDRDLRHLARLDKLEGTSTVAPPRTPKAPKNDNPALKALRPRSPRGSQVAPTPRPVELPIDGQCQAVLDNAPNGIVPWILMAAYTYHIHNVSMISDGMFDHMCKKLLADWDKVEHRHKHLITQEDLRAGSLYRLKAVDYPSVTRCAAENLLRATNHRIDPDKDIPK